MRHRWLSVAAGTALVAVFVAWQVVRFREPFRAALTDSPLSPVVAVASWVCLLGGTALIARGTFGRRGASDEDPADGEGQA